MYKIQVMMMDGKWQDCQRLATFADGKWTTPEFTSVEACQAAINEDSDIVKWQTQNIVRIIPTGFGIIYLRRPRGKKLTFLMSGPSFEEAPKFVNWQGVAQQGNVVVWVGEDKIMRDVAVPEFKVQAQMKFDFYTSLKHGQMDAVRFAAQDLGRPAIDVAEAVGLTNEFIKNSIHG